MTYEFTTLGAIIGLAIAIIMIIKKIHPAYSLIAGALIGGIIGGGGLTASKAEMVKAIAFDPYTHGYYKVTERVGEAFKDGLRLKK